MSDSDTTSSITPSASSTRPYLVRAMYEWCADNGFTPYIAAYVDGSVQVPFEFVKNNEIVLNVGMDATSDLHMDNECITFKARFSGIAREIMVPMERVMAIYARENGQGMTFPVTPNIPVASKPLDAVPPIHSVSQDVESQQSSDAKVVQLIKPKSSKAVVAKLVEDSLPAVGENSESGLSGGVEVAEEPPKSPTPSRGGLKRVK